MLRMENKTVSDDTLWKAMGKLDAVLSANHIEQATIEYFFTLPEGKPAHTFKVSYEDKNNAH